MTEDMGIQPHDIPLFLVSYAFILTIVGVYLGIASLFDPTAAVDYDTEVKPLASTWAGRTLGFNDWPGRLPLVCRRAYSGLPHHLSTKTSGQSLYVT